MKNAFSTIHPFVQLLYFSSVLVFSMCLMHPVLLSVSFLSALGYAVYLRRGKMRSPLLKLILPMMLLIALCNPLFNHAGVTILAYFPSGNPLTLESLLFGAAAGVMFAAVSLWCCCLQVNLSSDRVIYLFSKISPKLGLLLSMILRFIPKLTCQFQRIRLSQHCIGRDLNQGSLLQRTRNGVRIVSALLQWLLENAIDTADSLKSRGYGLKHRTSFSLFHFDRRDAILTAILVVLIGAVLAAAVGEVLACDYFPTFSIPGSGPLQWSLYGLYAVLCLLPILTDGRENRKWSVLRSKI